MWTRPLSRALIASIILAASAVAAEPKKLDADTLAMVEAFLKLPVDQMPAQHIDRFIAVDAAAVPPKLRKKFEARKLELHTLKGLAAGKKKGTVRITEKDCAVPDEMKAGQADVYKMAGYVEIEEHEVDYLVKRTQCTQPELMCEFSLRIIVENKGKKKFIRYFLHQNDPLTALVQEYRSYGGARNTNFFGMMAPTCTR